MHMNVKVYRWMPKKFSQPLRKTLSSLRMLKLSMRWGGLVGELIHWQGVGFNHGSHYQQGDTMRDVKRCSCQWVASSGKTGALPLPACIWKISIWEKNCSVYFWLTHWGGWYQRLDPCCQGRGASISESATGRLALPQSSLVDLGQVLPNSKNQYKNKEWYNATFADLNTMEERLATNRWHC